MRKLLVLLLSFVLLGPLLASGAADREPVPDQDLEAAVSEILNRSVEDEEYGEVQRCIGRAQYRRVEVLDERLLAFIGRDGRIWLNQLRAPCSGLNNRLALQMFPDGFRACRLDRFHGVDPAGMRGFERTPACFLGDFERISEEQLALLKEAVSERGPRRVSDGRRR
jgi:hypothetical protein